MGQSLAHASLLLVAVSAAGATLPLLRPWSARFLHFFVSISAGVFLGAIFLHLLPELALDTARDAEAHGGHGALLPWAAALAGLLALFVVQKILLEHDDGGDPHDVVWFATFLGLWAHSFATGLGYAGVIGHAELYWPFLGSMALHKAGEAFSLATVMRLGHVRTPRAVGFLALYCAATPIGLWLGGALSGQLEGLGLAPALTGLATGTFLYVAVGDLLPEVFHGGGRRFGLLGLLLGLVAAWAGLIAPH